MYSTENGMHRTNGLSTETHKCVPIDCGLWREFLKHIYCAFSKHIEINMCTKFRFECTRFLMYGWKHFFPRFCFMVSFYCTEFQYALLSMYSFKILYRFHQN